MNDLLNNFDILERFARIRNTVQIQAILTNYYQNSNLIQYQLIFMDYIHSYSSTYI